MRLIESITSPGKKRSNRPSVDHSEAPDQSPSVWWPSKESFVMSKQLEYSRRQGSWARPKPISLKQPELVKRGFLYEGGTVPLVIQPQMSGVVDLFAWARSHAEFIDSNLMKHG